MTRPSGLIQTLNSDSLERAVVLKLSAERNRAAAHLAILDVLLRTRAHVNACFEALTAVRAAYGDKLLRRDARALSRGLIDRLQTIKAVNMVLFEACDPACQGFEFRILATGHGHSFYTPADARAGPNKNEVAEVKSSRPGPRFLACSILCAILYACGGAGSLSPDPPAGIDLGGTWRLNRGLSEDPEKMFETWRQKMLARSANLPDPPVARGGRDAPPDPATDPNNPQSAEYQSAINGPGRKSPFDIGVFGNIPRGDLVTIKQHAQEFYIDDGLSDRSFTPGTKSVVSVPEGVADQHSGWKGKQYVIDARAQAGPETIERYHLSDDGKQLVAEIQSSGGNMPTIKFKRIYDRVGAAATAAPTND